MALIECPTCEKMTEEGCFCEKCGAELPLSLSDAPAQEQDGVEDDLLDLGNETIGMDSTIYISPQIKTVVAAEHEPLPVDSHQFLQVEYDKSRVFVVGQTMNFRFSLTPLVEGMSDVFVAVAFEGRGQKVEVNQLGWIPCKGDRRELRNINFAAPEAGSMGFSFYFGFLKDEIQYVFEADGEHKVWPAHARAQDVVRNIEINIQNSGHAVDFQFDGIKEKLSSNETLEAVIDQLHSMPPVWSGLQLYKSTWRPPRTRKKKAQKLFPVALDMDIPFSARTDKLTLRTNSRTIHLLSGTQIHCGKNRNNDIVTRLFQNGTATRELNTKISRYHCIIERDGKNCYVINRGDYPNAGSQASAFGLFLDGKNIPSMGRKKLDLQESSTLSLAGSDCLEPGVFSFELEPWKCSSSMRRNCTRDCERRKTASLVLRRRDAVPETYIALWECFLLGEADPDFDGIVVWREENGFGYATADADGWLQPGITIQTPQCEIYVEEWGQEGMKK